MRPGLTGLEMGNEAFLYFAYELGKQRARDSWSDYLPAIRAEYEKGLTESYEQPKIEYKGFKYETEPLEDEDTRKILHYVVSPSGKRADIDWSSWEYMTQEDFELWLHAGMPSRKDAGSIGPLDHDALAKLAQVDENSVTPLQNKADLEAKRKAIQDLQTDPNTAKDPQMKQAVIDRKNVLDKQAKDKGFEESRGHTILANKLKDIERAKKFASGELKVPTPQERRAELEKPKKDKVDEYGATSTGSQPNAVTQTTGSDPDADTAIGGSTANDADAKVQAAKIAQGANAIKSVTGSQASGPNLVKALNTAMQGKADSTSAKDLQPVMDVVGQAIQDPQVNNSFKNLVQQAKQSKAKLQQQQK
jgi:hypothetical protein